MAKYFIQRENLVSIADEVRTISGVTNTLPINTMKSSLQEANNNINTESELISQIMSALQGKTNAAISEVSIKTTTKKLSSNGTTITFEGLTQEPKMFAIAPTGNITLGSTRYVTGVMYDGETTSGTYGYRSSSTGTSYYSASYFTWTYSDGVLTVKTSSSTNGGNFSSSVTYKLAYVEVPEGSGSSSGGVSLPTLTNEGSASDLLSGKQLINSYGNIVTGTIQTKTSSNLTASGATVTVPAGYYASQSTKSVATATQATPSISVNSSGLITASATQTAGYVNSGTKSSTQQLTTKAAATITPTTSNQTIASGTYLTGTQTIKGDANLVSSNIKKGFSIFGVSGSYEGAELNFEVVGGTSQPSSPVENTIWVNTNTTITSWVFSVEQPNNPSNGMVWITIDMSNNIGFNALKNNGIHIYLCAAKQYVNGAWVDVISKIYQNNEWTELMKKSMTIYNIGNLYQDITGGWEIYNGTRETAVINDTGIVFSRTSGSSGKSATVATKNKINVTEYETLFVNVLNTASTGKDGYVEIGILESPSAAPTFIASKQGQYGETGEFELDLSNISGEYYIAIRGYYLAFIVTEVVLK